MLRLQLTLLRLGLFYGIVLGQTPTITNPSSFTPRVTDPPSTATAPQSFPTLISSLLECYNSWMANALEWSWADDHRTTTVIPYTTKTLTSLTWPESAPFTTLCDGIPRAVNPPVATTSVSWVTTDFNASETLYPMPPLSNPAVDCNFCDRCDDCNALSHHIATESSKWSEQSEPRSPSTLSLWLPCGPGTPTPFGPTTPVVFPTAPNAPSCIIKTVGQPGSSSATLFYWPVTTISGDFCKQDGQTATATQTISGKENTAVYNGMTLTSPTAVLIIEHLSANVRYTSNRRSYWTDLGPTHASATISIHQTALSTVNHAGNRLSVGSPLTSYSFNYADLNTVPYPKYSTAYCRGAYENCERIWRAYAPKVGIPHEVSTLKSEWRYCTAWGSVRPVAIPITAGVTTTVTSTAGSESPEETGNGEEVPE